MKLLHYAETDSLYFEPNGEPSAETREISDGVNIDLDCEGAVVGIDIDRASTKSDRSAIETSALPLRATRAA